MAKCVQNPRTKLAVRVPDDEAARLVEKEGYVYISKTQWRRLMERVAA